MFDRIKDALSVEFVKAEILKTAYGNRETLIANLDPRTLILWSAIFTLVPWFFYNRVVLIGFLLLVVVVALMARVSGLIWLMLLIGVVGEVTGWIVTSFFFGGDLRVFFSLTTLMLKLLTVSLASMAVFSSIDPDRFADALLAMGMPDPFAFGLSYAYRMIPVLFEEYQTLINAYRLRSKEPERNGFLYWRKGVYFLRLMVRAFYPMILNTAQRTRTTVEGLEIKGYTYALEHPEVKELKLQHLQVHTADYLFVGATTAAIVAVIVLGSYFRL